MSLVHLAERVVLPSPTLLIQRQLVLDGAKLLKIVLEVAFVLHIRHREIISVAHADTSLSIG
jgi:hypothetical protein